MRSSLCVSGGGREAGWAPVNRQKASGHKCQFRAVPRRAEQASRLSEGLCAWVAESRERDGGPDWLCARAVFCHAVLLTYG